MTKPNYIPGMRRKGVKRAPLSKHLNKLRRSWFAKDAYLRKAELELARRERGIS